MKKQNILLLSGSIFLIISFFSTSMNSLNAQEETNNSGSATSTTTINNNSNNFIINIREISSSSEKNMIALLSSNDVVQVKKVDVSKAEIQPGQEDSYSPNKMIDVPITMNKTIESGSEIYACVIQLGSSSFSQSIKCNIAYASPTASGEPQRIIVPL
ncbi:MAG: hypothetical protein ACR2F1_00935 [Nitrososphaeraceae archaeon]